MRRAIAGYLIALAAVLVAVLARGLLDPWLDYNVPFITIFGAVAVTAWLAGYEPAIAAAIVGYLACDYFFIPPRGGFIISEVPDMVGLVLYLLTAAVIIVMGDVMRRTQGGAVEDRERLRVTLSSIGDAVITTDADGRVTMLNPIAEQLTGWKISEALGRPLPEVFHILNEYSRQVVENPVAKVFASGRIVGLANHTALIAKDGTEKPIDDSAAPIRDQHGDRVGCVLVFRDVTQRRRLEKEAAERLRTARLLASIIESSDDAIVSKSLDGILQTWNVGAERIFGHRRSKRSASTSRSIIPRERIGEEDEIIARLRAGERVDHFETVAREKGRRRIDVR